MVAPLMENGILKPILDTVEVIKSGKTEAFTMVIGKMVMLTAEEG